MSAKTKNIILIVGFLIAGVLCHELAISKTIALKKEHTTLTQQSNIFENVPKQIALLKHKEKYYDSLFLKYQLNGGSIQNNLLKTINSYADDNNLKIVSFLEPHIVNTSDLKISTYQFTLEGDYNNILKLIHKLEQETKFGEIINLHFVKKTNFKTGTDYLQAQVLMKNFS